MSSLTNEEQQRNKVQQLLKKTQELLSNQEKIDKAIKNATIERFNRKREENAETYIKKNYKNFLPKSEKYRDNDKLGKWRGGGKKPSKTSQKKPSKMT